MTVVVVCGSVVALAVEVVLLAALISVVIERKDRHCPPATTAPADRRTDRNGGYNR
jgi:hypothetical protein